MKAAFFEDDELTASLLAGGTWSAHRDLPDVVKWADLMGFPSEVLPLVRSRLDASTAPSATQQFPIPKEGAVSQRSVTISDPYDELIYRCLTGRIVTEIGDTLGSEVKSYRLSSPAPGWRLRHYRYGNEARREDGLRFIESDIFGAFGVMDVREYYPSISIGGLAAVLDRIGAPTCDLAALATYLQDWVEVWGVRGLPIGFESSGVLGNAMLLPLDSALRASGAHFSRYTDDIHLYLNDRDAWPTTRDLVTSTLGQLGLDANDKKTKCALTPAVARRLAGHDPELGCLSVALRQKDPSARSQLKAMFDRESGSADPDGRRLRFALRVFQGCGDDHAIRALIDRPVLFSYGAPAWGRYISQMRSEGKCDQDWLLEVASVQTTTTSACLQFHALRALGYAGRLSKDAVVRIEELATSCSPGWGPVKGAAADAWARCDGWKAGGAVDAALSAGDTSHQRALALSLRHGCESRKRRRAFRKLRTLPGCRPAVAWMEAGCPPVP